MCPIGKNSCQPLPQGLLAGLFLIVNCKLGWAWFLVLQVVNYSESRTAEEICESSSKMITFIDLAGHHKYLKTTIFGLTSYCPDFAMLVVSANTGIGELLSHSSHISKYLSASAFAYMKHFGCLMCTLVRNWLWFSSCHTARTSSVQQFVWNTHVRLWHG